LWCQGGGNAPSLWLRDRTIPATLTAASLGGFVKARRMPIPPVHRNACFHKELDDQGRYARAKNRGLLFYYATLPLYHNAIIRPGRLAGRRRCRGSLSREGEQSGQLGRVLMMRRPGRNIKVYIREWPAVLGRQL
jgi:hypothetical protein